MRPLRGALAGVALGLCGCAGVADRAGPAVYTIDPTHTFVAFEVAHFGTSTSRGRFDRTRGEVMLDRAGGTSRAEITVATGSVNTGVPALDSRLRGPDFLDSEAFPEARFVGDAFTFGGSGVSEVAGRLTLRGQTLPVTLKATNFNCYLSPLLVRQVCGGDFEATLQPSRWGVSGALAIGLGDEVRLHVQVEAISP